MTNEANTPEPAAAGREAATRAEELVGEADALLTGALPPGHLPTAADAEGFLSEGKVDRVLALYGQAMRFDPGEPAYPWNLGAALNRLGLNDLALAEVALDAGEHDLALTALAHARAEDPAAGRAGQIAELRSARRDPRPQASLVALLEQLPA